MDSLELDVRNATYRSMVDLGRAPTIAEVASRTGRDTSTVADSWRRLHDGHALVLADRDATEPAIRMLNPFSAVETPFVVEAGGLSWFANCGWDAFGIAVVLRSDATIRTTCPDCAEPLALEVRDLRPLDPSPVFHALMPARDWWSDIGFT